MPRILAAAFALVTLCLVRSDTLAAAARTNVVLILADDLGYECIGANGGTSYRTPHLDKLAAGGVRFEHCYAQPLCTPSRVQLMTGLYNVRNYTRFAHLDPEQETFAQLFKKAGFATGIAGKWQLAGGLEAPKHFGFDEYCLWQLNRRPSRYANPGLEINGRRVNYSGGEYGPDIVNRFAIDFIAKHKDRPFLLYYPMMLTHPPFQPTPDSKEWNPKATGERANNKPAHFADMVSYMDKLIGQLIAALDKHGLRENTLVLFLADNGTAGRISSKMGDRTVRGGKGKTTDAGMHVPLIANWAKTIPAGSVCRDLVDTTDFFPTICEVAGVPLPQQIGSPPTASALDGRSFLPQLRGEKGQPREWIYCWYARQGGAVAQKEFAANQHFKLYGDGRFFDIGRDRDEEQPLVTKSFSSEAKAARTLLQSALDRFRDARPARLKDAAGKPGQQEEAE